MAGSPVGKRSGGPWYGDFRRRLRFERGALSTFSGLTNRLSSSAGGLIYRIQLHVPYYDDRRVEIRFGRPFPSFPAITVDGPTTSPHRYSENELCIWFPGDDIDQQWTLEDGLLELLVLVQAHLFREAWWRETGEWPGLEAPHLHPKREAAGGS